MTVYVDIDEAKTHLSRLLEQVAAGERVVISKAGTKHARPGPPTCTRPRNRRNATLRRS